MRAGLAALRPAGHHEDGRAHHLADHEEGGLPQPERPDEFRRAGFEKALNSGIVLTGGGAMLEGVGEVAEQILDLPIRRGAPAGLGGLADHVNSPAFSTAVGLVMYAHRNQAGEPARPVGAGAFGRVAVRLRTLFRVSF